MSGITSPALVIPRDGTHGVQPSFSRSARNTHSAGGDARAAVQEAREPEQHGAAHDLGREGRPVPGAAAQDGALEGLLALGVEAHAGQVAEARVDPVGERAAVQVGQHPRPRGVHRRQPGGGDPDRLPVEHDAAVAGEVEPVRAVEDDHR